jgi:hypothetical protein
MRAMSWVLTNRVGPALDRRDAHPSELIFGITWWDSCRRGGVVPEFEPNVVSRAWTFGDYLDNVLRDGMTDVNRNYASYRWQQSLSFSSLVQRRGAATSLAHLTAALRPGAVPAPQTPAETALLRRWRTDIETGHECLFSPSEMQALAEVVRFAGERQMALTVVLFPLKPATVTESGRLTTLDPFSREMRALAEHGGFRLVDLTHSPILGDDDFMADFDHVTADGNRKFADWALAHGLGFLLELRRSAGDDRHAHS